MTVENAFLAGLRRIATDSAARGLLDDVAVLGDLVLTHDMIVEGVHFLPDDRPVDVAWKLVAVNLSDLASKGAVPVGILAGAGNRVEGDVLERVLHTLADAHARGFAFFGGVPGRGIYDNMKTAVTSVFTGKERVFNRRFLIMTDHYMVEPTACSPAAGWEKGQVENQVQTIRGRFFQPRLRFASLEELNGWLEAECRRWAERQPHPEQGELTVAQVLEIERSALQPMLGPFDGFNESEHAVTGTCLISFDRNRYSVLSTVARRTVQVRAYADRIVVRCGEEVVAEHPRYFGRNRTIYDPWHYLPVLARKPGALRNGAPFQDWDLPPALARLRRKLGNGDDADRRFVRVLSAVLTDGLEPVEAAVREALATGTASDDLILNILARRREPPRPLTIITSEDSALRHPPIADCARYDQLRTFDAAA